MPVYAYRCRECEHYFEKYQRMSDAPLSDCPSCHGSVRRVINQVGVVFKGSGFYITDNRNGSAANGRNGAVNGSGKPAEEKSDSAAASEASKTEKSSPVSDKADKSKASAPASAA